MRIVLACATRRGYRFLEKLASIMPDSEIIVCTFREETHEPPFFDDICNLTRDLDAKFFQVKNLGNPEILNYFNSYPIDLLFAVSWRFMIPPEIVRLSKFGSYVFHDSLLPKYRGFSPTVWAILNGEEYTGATLLEMSPKMDEGDIVDQESIRILHDDTIADVMERVTTSYLSLLQQNIQRLISGDYPKYPQDHTAATYGCKRVPGDNLIDWGKTNQDIYNLIRASSHPYSGAYTFLDGKKLIIWSALPLYSFSNYVGRVFGRIVEAKKNRVVVLTGNNAMLLNNVQLEGCEPQEAGELINSLGITLGNK